MPILAVVHCKLTDRNVVKTCTMSMSDGVRSTLSGLLGPAGERGESIAVGQVAMATDHDSQRIALTGGAGSPMGGRPSGTREDVATGEWMVRPLHGAPQGVNRAVEGGKDCA